MSTFVILLGGELHATPRLMSQVAGHSVIAADSGMEHAALLGVTPEAWLGDFDSAGEALFDRYPDVPRMAFPQDKDMTDGELAIAEALSLEVVAEGIETEIQKRKLQELNCHRGQGYLMARPSPLDELPLD